jgi:uncharacterized spore protein YtfJ
MQDVEDMQDMGPFIDELGDHLTGLAKADMVVGSPITLGKVTIVPLSELGLGFGGGGGGGEDAATEKRPKSTGSGLGSGGGGRVKPIAVAVFREDGVEIMKLPDKPSAIARLLDKVPDLIEKLKS